MKKPALLLPFLCFFFSFSQVKKSSFDSFKLSEKRDLKLYVPEDYSEEKTYPLLVVLDADYLFDIVVSNSKFYNYNDNMPQTIVVGVSQSNSRELDCAYGENGFPEKKSAAFFEFIGMELIPSLQKNYKLSNFKAIVGHSLTGNFINYFLFKEKPLFDAYISLSPSFAPQMEQNITDRLSAIQNMKFYYLATGTNDYQEEKERIKNLNTNIKSLSNDKLHYYFDELNGANNYSVSAYGIPKALDQIFNIYKPISKEEYKTKVLAHEGPVIEYLTEKYTTIEQLFGFKKTISLNDMMAIYAAIKKKEDLPSLEELSKLAKKDYPDTMLGFFFEAEYYEQLGEPKKAMRTYEKAFGMSEIDFITKDLALDRIDKIKQDFGW